jgi:hypothetical protein
VSFLRRLGGLAGSGAARAASQGPSAISDQQYAATLGAFARLADTVLDQPEHWLRVDGEPEKLQGRLGRSWRAARDAVTGDTHPGSPDWDSLPVSERVDWWVARIGVTAGAVAAAPRFTGLVSDRLPIQAGLGAAASGLAVCAVARENGIDDPVRWVPMLAQVIFDRRLDHEVAEAETPAAGDVGAVDEVDGADAAAAPGEDQDGLPKRTLRAMWRLARMLLELQSVFDERPRGGFLGRALGKLPVIGVVGGLLDERGAIAAAARETQGVIDTRATSR